MGNEFERVSTTQTTINADSYASSNGYPTTSSYAGSTQNSHILDVGLFTSSSGDPSIEQQARRNFINDIYDGTNDVFDIKQLSQKLTVVVKYLSGAKTILELLQNIHSIADFWASQGIEVGSTAALELDF